MSPKKFSFKPTKKDTLADKQQKRARRWRLNHVGNKLSGFSPEWWVSAVEIIGLIALLGLNFWLLLPFFGHKDQVNVFSAPVVPLLATMTEKLVAFEYGIRIWLLVFLIFFPLSFYYFVREISGRKLIGFLAGAFVLLPIGIFLPSRVSLGLLTDDGGHIASLTITPMVCLFLLKFLRKGHFWSGILASLTATAVALTSPIGLVVLSAFMGVITFSEMLLGQGRLKAIRFLVVLGLMTGFCAFWYHPGFVILTFLSSQGQLIKKTFFNLLPVSFFLVPILGVFGFLLFENRPQLQPIFIAFFLTATFGLFSLGAGITHALPSRFIPAFGISLSFLFGILLGWTADFLRFSPKIKQLKAIAPRRKLIATGTLILTFTFIILTILLRGRSWQTDESQILGFSSEEKVGVWEIREQAHGPTSFLGYGITCLTTLFIVFVNLKLKKKEVSAPSPERRK